MRKRIELDRNGCNVKENSGINCNKKRMEHWIFISSTKRFRMDDWLRDNDFVEYFQKNKVHVNDVVYLYTTAPVCRIEYKMIVERINIPVAEGVDDSAYSLDPQPVQHRPQDLLVRLMLVKKVNDPRLSLANLRKHGLKSSMQGNLKVPNGLID